MKTPAHKATRFKIGDFVREVDDTAVGVVVHVMKDAGLIVVNFPPSKHGIAFHPDDLEIIPQ
jgi:hypothetical protein